MQYPVQKSKEYKFNLEISQIVNQKVKKNKQKRITWKIRRYIHSDFSDFRPKVLRKKLTSVPSFVPVNSPV
jgi:hypothetical protein